MNNAGCSMELRSIDIFKLENALWVATKKTGISAYDFTFEPLFMCKRPYELPESVEVIARIGAFSDYEKQYSEFKEIGCKLINTPAEHFRASELASWYPLIEFCTPRSVTYKEIPEVRHIEQDFEYPVFIKGSRQTAKHNESLSVARNSAECKHVLEQYKVNSILHWQDLVCREYIDLMPVPAQKTEKVSPSFEFRTFWFKGASVGEGHYWSEFVKYDWSEGQRDEAMSLAQEVANLVDVPFLVIDLALTNENKWIVIECNDGQESGYAGMSPIKLWKNIVRLSR